MDKKIDINLKIKILKTATIYLDNTLIIPEKILGINYVNMESLSKEDPYYKSIEMLKNIISELNEESRLFEAFMYFDSQIIQNILLKNTQQNFISKIIFGQNVNNEQPEYITEYGISLMTIDEIKGHLLSLLPKVIVQIDSNLKMKALYEKKQNL